MSDDTTRSRLRFETIQRASTPDGRCLVTVTLEWAGNLHAATTKELETPQGVLNAASKAALDAALEAVPGVDLEMVGVKAVRAFDGWVVVTRLGSGPEAGGARLLGAAPCEAEEDLPAAAVMAVLDASNRVFERALSRLADAVS